MFGIVMMLDYEHKHNDSSSGMVTVLSASGAHSSTNIIIQ